MTGTTLESAKNPGNGRRGRANYDAAFRSHLAAAACEPGVSVSKLVREHGIDANMLVTWRRQYRAQLAVESAPLLPVTLVSGARGSRARRARARTPNLLRCGGIQARSKCGSGRRQSRFPVLLMRGCFARCWRHAGDRRAIKRACVDRRGCDRHALRLQRSGGQGRVGAADALRPVRHGQSDSVLAEPPARARRLLRGRASADR
ncbi:transposase [Pandoraea oxalativorans]|uniref:transposase n=1 Tax=Pandoraea oxalativorans TaxID=573737 RepID=UPI001FE17227|nr:transposase [Pandoraea oxalativorans]